MVSPKPGSLKIYTFGGLSILDGDQPISGLASRKAEVLLVYLTWKQRVYAREVLAELLWEDRTQSQAQANLRVVLSSLNKQLPSYVSIDRSTAGIQPKARIWLDAAEIEGSVKACSDGSILENLATIDRLQQALDLYHGEFLEGIYLQDAGQLQVWIEAQRRHLHTLVIKGLSLLTEHYLNTHNFTTGIQIASRLVSLDPVNETGQRQLIHLLALDGQRSAALAAFEHFKLLLAQELGIQPDPETTQLAARIQAGNVVSPTHLPTLEAATSVRLPDFLQPGAISFTPPPLFVGRETEIQHLESAIQLAVKGTGQLRFITGDPGQGKSLLMEHFARQASTAHPDLLVAMGGCNAFTGVGDAYLPFRDVLGMLTGRLENKIAAGSIDLEQAYRLWLAFPTAISLLLKTAPHLVGIFLSASEIHTRAVDTLESNSPLIHLLDELAARGLPAPGEMLPATLFEEFLQYLSSLSKEQPLLILLDDLQWADTASINLLFHLGRRIGSGRILLLVAYRAEEVAQAKAEQQASLKRILAEFKRQYGDIWIDLSAATEKQGRTFVEAFLDSEPNLLAESFRNALYDRTGGHPLFTVELCRSLQEQGLLAQDVDGFWQVQDEIQWHDLPARVEGVIEARLGSLEASQLAILEAAAVEGEEFTLQVVAQVCELDEHRLNRQVNESLCQTHHLLKEEGIQSIDGHRVYRYRFQHNLYREYLYQQLGEIDRSCLHGQVGEILEELYGEKASEISPALGWHFHEAGDTQKAIQYLLLAGDQARLRFAYAEAIRHYKSSVELLKMSGDYESAARALMKLGLMYHSNLEFDQSKKAYDEGFILWASYNQTQPVSSLVPAPHSLRTTLKFLVTLDRTIQNLTTVAQISYQIFSGLVAYDAGMNIIPDGAISWEVLDNGRKYIFHLRNDVYWSDGVPVTAGDYVFAWKRLLDPNLNSESGYQISEIKGARDYQENKGSYKDVAIHALDPYTLSVEMENPAGYFLFLLADSTMFPLPSHVLKNHRGDWTLSGLLLTNGPFKIDDWIPAEKLTLSRYEKYHGSFKGNLEQVEVFLNFDLESCISLYNESLLDTIDISYYEPTTIVNIKHQYPEEYVEVPSLGVDFISFHAGKPPFHDRRTRQAFSHAIDKKTNPELKKNMDTPASGGLIPQGMPGYSPGIGLPYDPEKARRLLAEAGYPGGVGFPDVTIIEADFPAKRLKVQWLCNQWYETLGVNIQPRFIPLKSAKTWSIEEFNIGCLGLLPDYPDCDYYIRNYLGGYLLPCLDWKHPMYDHLLQNARMEVNQQKRLKFYMQADQLLIDEAVLIPMVYFMNSFLIKPWVRLYTFISPGIQIWKDFLIEPH
jgi:ABC-type oligopeptide transport system substrate-binding subunit/DNA-binding SARP family transcriptional activator/tetratricopeptide (TPR) repeat protein